MLNPDNCPNDINLKNDKLLRVFSHLFFITLLIAFVFAISAVINIMTQRAYNVELQTAGEQQVSSSAKSDTITSAENLSVGEASSLDKFSVGEASSLDKFNAGEASSLDRLESSAKSKQNRKSTPKKSGNNKLTAKKVTMLSGEDLGFHVTGIIINKKGNRAVITSKNGKSYMIQAGEKIGEWNVESIDKEQVVLKTDGYVARLEPSVGCRSLKMPVKDTFEGVVGIDDEDPGFRLTGIMKNDREINAILTGLDGKNYTVKPGQVVGAWTVSFITDKMVFLKNNRTMTIAVLELAPSSQEMEDMKQQEHYQDVMVL